MNTRTVIVIAIFIFNTMSLIFSCFVAIKVHAESYSYVDIKIGSFFDACRSDICIEPDGKLPTYGALGHEWVFGRHWVAGFELQHRSNLDIGWPIKGQTDKEEYYRNGAFLKARYKFNFSE